jgi:diaminohydroxyphosphoribosylaminopyrimidine deaminase/5-amino-6-(5-phosphoribosylamino)uracil reductase
MLSLRAVLKILTAVGARSLLVEGGGEIHASFIREKLADEALLFIAPKILGGKAPTWVGGTGVANISRAASLRDVLVEPLGHDFLLTGKFGG